MGWGQGWAESGHGGGARAGHGHALKARGSRSRKKAWAWRGGQTTPGVPGSPKRGRRDRAAMASLKASARPHGRESWAAAVRLRPSLLTAPLCSQGFCSKR